MDSKKKTGCEGLEVSACFREDGTVKWEWSKPGWNPDAPTLEQATRRFAGGGEGDLGDFIDLFAVSASRQMGEPRMGSTYGAQAARMMSSILFVVGCGQMSEDKVIVEGTISRHRTLKDGSLVIEIEVHTPESAQRFFRGMTGEPAIPVVVARMSDQAARESLDSPGWPKYAHILWQQGFFRNPAVQAVAGTDEQFLEWIRGQKSAVSGRMDQAVGKDGYSVEERCQAAHVRRSGRSGVGMKPKYMAIPLTASEHALQHSKGESALMPREEFERKAVDYGARWCKEQIKADMGYASFSDVPHSEFLDWARAHEVIQHVPSKVKDL